MAKGLVKSVRIPEPLWRFVEERAAKRGISPNAWIVRMVRQVYDGMQKGGG